MDLLGKNLKKFRNVALGLLLSLTLAACSGAGGDGISSIVGGLDDTGGSGGSSGIIQAVLSGTVYTSTDSGGDSLFKAGTKAGETTSTRLPATGATILIYDIDSTATAAAATATTGIDGSWTAAIDPGNYVIFSVYMDLTNFTLKVDRIDNVAVNEGDTAVETEDQVVAADTDSPSVIAILDSSSGEVQEDNSIAFTPSDIFVGQDIAVFFSESMNRTSVENSFSLTDASEVAVPFTVLVNGALTEFRLTPTEALLPETVYTLTIDNSTAKDLVNNELDADVTATITTLAADAVVEDLAVVQTKPGPDADGLDATGVPIFTSINIGFNYPVKFESLKGALTITPPLTGRLQVLGKKATFFPDEPMEPNTTYEFTVGVGTVDLSERPLAVEYVFSFTTGDALMAGATGETLDIVELIGLFQAALDSGNYTSLSTMLTPDFLFEDEYWEFDPVTGQDMLFFESFGANEFIDMLMEDEKMGEGFGDVERKSISKVGTPALTMLVEHFKNDTFGDLYRGFIPPEYGKDFVEIEKEIIEDNGSGFVNTRMERFMYILAGGQFEDVNAGCATSSLTADIQVFDQWGGPTFDPNTGRPITESQTFEVVDGDCNSTNSWATDQDFGNDPWPQDMDENTENDPVPYNDNNLDSDLQDIITSQDEIWNNAEKYFIPSVDGDWVIKGSTDLLLEIAGPKGYPYPIWPQPDYTATGGCDPNTDPNCVDPNQIQCDPNTDPNCVDPNQTQCDPNTDPNCVDPNQTQCDPMTDTNCTPPCDPTLDPNCTIQAKFKLFGTGGGDPSTAPPEPEGLDLNPDGDWNPDTCPSDVDWTVDNCTTSVIIQRIPVNATGVELTAAELESSFMNGTEIRYVLEVLANDVGLTVGSTIDVEPDWWLMNDDGEFGEFDPMKWQNVMMDTTDAVVIVYHLENKIKINLPQDGGSPISFSPDGLTAVAFLEIEMTETWFPHPPYDPEHPDRADLNGDGVVDETDNTFIHFEHRLFSFKNIGEEWKLAKIEMAGSQGGPPGATEFESFGLPIRVDSPFNPTGPAVDAGINPVFTWSFDDFPADAKAEIGSVALFIMELGAVDTTTNSKPEPVKAFVVGFDSAVETFTYGDTNVGENITEWVISDNGDFPVTDPTALIDPTALTAGKAYMFGVIAFKGDFRTDGGRDLGETPPILFATTTLPDGFGPQGPPISGAQMKVKF